MHCAPDRGRWPGVIGNACHLFSGQESLKIFFGPCFGYVVDCGLLIIDAKRWNEEGRGWYRFCQ